MRIMSKITIDKYVDLDERFASYDNDGYYIDSIMIPIMIADNLHYGLSFSELKEFVKKVDVAIDKEELDTFLNQKMEEDFPLITEKLKERRKKDSSSSPIKCMEDVEMLLIESRNSNDSSTLEYFKNYLDGRKKRCATLFAIYEDMEAVKKEKQLTKESIDRFQKLDINFNEDGYVYYEDALRLTKTIIFNVEDLFEIGDLANRLETYLDFKVTRESLEEARKRNLEIYPREEVQLLDSKYIGNEEFFPLSKRQAAEWRKKEVKQKIKRVL